MVFIYVGTYTQVEGHVPDGKGEGVVTLQYDPETGTLEKTGVLACGTNPTFLTLNSAGTVAYIVNECDEGGEVIAAKINKETGVMQKLNAVPNNMKGACHVTLDKTEQNVVVAGYVSGTTGVWRINDDGSLAQQPASFITHADTGKIPVAGTNPDRQEANHAHQVYVSPSNNFVYVPDLGADCVIQFGFNAATGELTFKGKIDAAPGAGPRHLVFHPNGKFMYILNELFCTVAVCSVDSETGEGKIVQTLTTLPEGVPVGRNGQSFSAAIRISADGKFLYASNRGFDTITIYSVDSESGNIKFAAHVPTGFDVKELPVAKWPPIHTPRDFILFGEERALIANQDSHQIVSFARDAKTGMLTQQKVLEVFSPVCLAVGSA